MSTIMVNGIEVPEPMREAPKKEEILWRVDIDNFNGVDQIVWFASEWQRWMLKNGLCHLTESAARQHFDALIAPSRADAQQPKSPESGGIKTGAQQANSVEIDRIKEPEWSPATSYPDGALVSLNGVIGVLNSGDQTNQTESSSTAPDRTIDMFEVPA